MTSEIWIVLYCDYGDCSREMGSEVAESVQMPVHVWISKLRMRNDGWTHLDGRDYCPEHIPL